MEDLGCFKAIVIQLIQPVQGEQESCSGRKEPSAQGRACTELSRSTLILHFLTRLSTEGEGCKSTTFKNNRKNLVNRTTATKKVIKFSSSTEIVMRGASSLLLSVISSLSRCGRKVWYLKSCLKGFIITHLKQWQNGNSFFNVSFRLLFYSSKDTAIFTLFFLFSQPSVFPLTILFLFTFSIYLTCYPFSPPSFALIVQSLCV